MQQTMSLYCTLKHFHQAASTTSKEEQSSVDNVLGHDVCNFQTQSFSVDEV